MYFLLWSAYVLVRRLHRVADGDVRLARALYLTLLELKPCKTWRWQVSAKLICTFNSFFQSTDKMIVLANHYAFSLFIARPIGITRQINSV